MSGDKEQGYFSDGLAEEILNLLAKIDALKVIARSSSFAFRGKELDVRKITEALDLRTILESASCSGESTSPGMKSGRRVRCEVSGSDHHS